MAQTTMFHPCITSHPTPPPPPPLPPNSHEQYGVGICSYNLGIFQRAAQCLSAYFSTRAAALAAGESPPLPPPGTPFARFTLAHALLQGGQYAAARGALHAYLVDVADAGPQHVLNMPAGMYGGKKVHEGCTRAKHISRETPETRLRHA